MKAIAVPLTLAMIVAASFLTFVLADAMPSGDNQTADDPTGSEDHYNIAITELHVKDVQGLEITGCADCALSMLMLTAEMRSYLPTAEGFVIYLEVRDAEGYTIFNEFGTGTLEPEGFTEVAISWVPVQPGDYELRSFVFDSLQNTERLSKIETVLIQVN